jgi:hypothetical protein
MKECGNVINDETPCCKAMESYVRVSIATAKLPHQLASLENCAASIGTRLQEANVSYYVYNLCHINLKDFSL